MPRSLFPPRTAPSDPGGFARYLRSLPALRLMIALLASLAVWAPEPLHYHVSSVRPDPAVIDGLRRAPEDRVLDEIAEYALGIRIRTPAGPVPAARQIAAGSLPALDFPPFAATPEAYPRDLTQGGATQQLIVASFGMEQVLLDAYASTGDPALLALATARMLSLADDEAKRWRPVGLLWNDHAVASRVGVVAQWWRHYRRSPAYSDDVASRMLRLVVRSGRILAKPSHFTAWTNHGVLQNLALLQIAASFPQLSEAAGWRELAMHRLSMQLSYYVSDEGFVLEHSADYHFLGVELLTQTVRVLQLLGEPAPAGLQLKLSRAQEILGLLLRPDGTLPLTGNTALAVARGIPAQPSPAKHLEYLPPRRNASQALLAPLSGYALWWAGDAETQTLTAWSYFPGHGHKHADEPSVQLWHQDTSWITASGYWPYDAPGYFDANGWAGSNAPHLVDEPATSPRESTAHATGNDGEMRMIDVERRGPRGFSVRRQVVQIGPRALVVLDLVQGAPGKTARTVWTTDPRARMRVDAPGRATATRDKDGTQSMRIGFTGSARLLRGSYRPFAGWVVEKREPMPADALVFEYGATSNQAAYAFELGPAAAASRDLAPRLEADARPDHWRITLSLEGVSRMLSRDGDVLRLTGPDSSRELKLQQVDNRDAARGALVTAQKRATDAYPRWRDLSSYRWKLIQGFAGLAIALELAIFAFATWRGSERILARRATLVNAAALVGWTVIAAWALLRYLR